MVWRKPSWKEGIFKSSIVAVSVVQTLILAGTHRSRHLPNHGDSGAILEGPHTLQVKESHPVTTLQRVIQVRLETRHGAEIAVNEGDAAQLGRHLHVSQQVSNRTAGRQVNL
jgi:hypothetical protein